MESINIGLAGLGTVAQGFLEIFGQKKTGAFRQARGGVENSEGRKQEPKG